MFKERWSRQEMDRVMADRFTHCLTCGGPLGATRVRCAVCQEWQCSDECRQKHTKTMDAI